MRYDARIEVFIDLLLLADDGFLRRWAPPGVEHTALTAGVRQHWLRRRLPLHREEKDCARGENKILWKDFRFVRARRGSVSPREGSK